MITLEIVNNLEEDVVSLELKIKTNETPVLFFRSINNSIKLFISKWINPSLTNKIQLKGRKMFNEKFVGSTPKKSKNSEKKIEEKNLGGDLSEMKLSTNKSSIPNQLNTSTKVKNFLLD